MRIGLDDLFGVGFLEDLFGGVELELLLDDVALIDVGGFETGVVVVGWVGGEGGGVHALVVKGGALYVLRLLPLLPLLLLAEHLPQTLTIIRQPPPISQLHPQILPHLFLRNSNQTLPLNLIFVEHLFISRQINLLKKLSHLLIIPLLYRLLDKG